MFNPDVIFLSAAKRLNLTALSVPRLKIGGYRFTPQFLQLNRNFRERRGTH
jgi:hypothetical protein